MNKDSYKTREVKESFFTHLCSSDGEGGESNYKQSILGKAAIL